MDQWKKNENRNVQGKCTQRKEGEKHKKMNGMYSYMHEEHNSAIYFKDRTL